MIYANVIKKIYKKVIDKVNKMTEKEIKECGYDIQKLKQELLEE